MAAGMGSRFGGLKQMAKFGPSGETLLEYSIYDAVRAGFDHVVFIIRKDIEKDFREIVGGKIEKRVAVDYVFQELSALPNGFTVPEGRTKPWGTGQAVLMAKEVVNNPFVVINGDDYYGRDAFEKAYQGLLKLSQDEYLMVGYILNNTLSESGGVSRGICKLDGEYLDAVNETHEVRALESIVIGERGGIGLEFTGAEVVSMNMFGMVPSFFPVLEKDFKEFLEKEGGAMKSEFYIPFVLTRMIQCSELKIRVFPTNSSWFGVTYAEDVPLVEKRILDLIQQGVYSRSLWDE
jgi:NDP-sugar pyrophosphorylase family protein